jgi:hypothetical protein
VSGGGCKLDTECPAATPQCVGGACVKACTADPECGAGHFCDQGACVLDTRPVTNCTDDLQCGGGGAPKKCLGGFCKYTCTAAQGNAYCRTIDNRIGFCAKDGVCRSQQEAEAACIFAADCGGGGKSCIDNQCK